MQRRAKGSMKAAPTLPLNAKSKELQKESIMLTILIILALFIVLDIAALRWGMDSTERVDSCEWERRSYWHDDANNLVAY